MGFDATSSEITTLGFQPNANKKNIIIKIFLDTFEMKFSLIFWLESSIKFCLIKYKKVSKEKV